MSQKVNESIEACKFFRKGTCTRCLACKFRHSLDDTHINVDGTYTKKIEDVSISDIRKFCKKGYVDNIRKILLWIRSENNLIIQDKYEWAECLILVCENNFYCMNCPGPGESSIHHDCPYIKMAEMILSDPENDLYIEEALYKACNGGFIEMINLLIKHGASYYDFSVNDVWNKCLKLASCNGYVKIVNIMISCGANDFDFALYEAERRGKIEIVKIMILKGAKHIDKYYTYKANEKEIIYLLENGVSMEKLKGIREINILEEKILSYKKTFRGVMMECYMINDLIGLMEEYLLI